MDEEDENGGQPKEKFPLNFEKYIEATEYTDLPGFKIAPDSLLTLCPIFDQAGVERTLYAKTPNGSFAFLGQCDINKHDKSLTNYRFELVAESNAVYTEFKTWSAEDKNLLRLVYKDHGREIIIEYIRDTGDFKGIILQKGTSFSGMIFPPIGFASHGEPGFDLDALKERTKLSKKMARRHGV